MVLMMKRNKKEQTNRSNTTRRCSLEGRRNNNGDRDMKYKLSRSIIYAKATYSSGKVPYPLTFCGP
eukprot:scaffold18881_cov138-Skeletonema_marinoi.AAC.7